LVKHFYTLAFSGWLEGCGLALPFGQMAMVLLPIAKAISQSQ